MALPQQKINFNLRPAKHIERKMLADMLGKLNLFGDLSNYRYIGFGSFYFTDFILFHKFLGIKHMINIEQDKGNTTRYEFNSPYKGIRHIFLPSNEALPQIDWSERKSILWLDYFCKLKNSVLTDVDTFFANATAGSFFLITINGEMNLTNSNDYDNFVEGIDKVYLSPDITKKKLAGTGFFQECFSVLQKRINEIIENRNGIGEGKTKLHFKPLVKISYDDGAKMFTIGGLLYSTDQSKLLESLPFSSLDYINPESGHYEIESPNLTFREIRHIDSKLALIQPTDKDINKHCKPVPALEAAKYLKIYRYFPTFTYADV
jgi:hypothetical protein